MRWFVVIVLLVCASVAPFLSSPDEVHAEPAPVGIEAQAQALGIVALCASNPACEAFVLAGATYYCIAAYQNGMGVCGYDTLSAVVDSIKAIWDANGAARAEFVNQFGETSTHFVITQAMLDAWWDAYQEFSATGWTHSGQLLDLAYSGWQSPQIGTAQTPANLVLNSDSFTIPSATCAGAYFDYNVLRGPVGGGTGGLTAKVELISDATGAAFSGGTDAAAWNYYNATAAISHYAPSQGVGLCSAAAGQVGHFRMTVPASGTMVDRHIWVGDVQWIGLKLTQTGSLPDLWAWTQAGDYTAVETNGLRNKPAAGAALTLPLNPDDLIGWNPAYPLPLADGTVGNPATTQEASPTDDPGFWEGLFDGLSGGLGAIKGVLENILTGVSDIADLVTSLPTVLVEAIAAALVPETTMPDRMDATATALGATAPFAWPGVVFAAFGDVFDGAGATCPEITIPADIGPWSDVTLTLCPPTGTGDITRLLSRVVAVLCVGLWGWRAFNGIVGSSNAD